MLERNAKTSVVIGNLDLAATAEFKRNALLSIDAERCTDGRSRR